MARYGRKARSKVKRAMHKRKRGTLRSGRSGRRAGAKVPKRRRRKSSRRKK